MAEVLEEADAQPPPAIILNGVSKFFPGGLHALDDLNLTVSNGEFIAVLGASGCGKSTLLRLVGGLDEPTGGVVRVRGGAAAEARRRRDIGIVFQDPALFPWRTVRQNIELPGEVFHDPGIIGRVDDWIARVGLQGFEDALPAALSGGMKSRVAIARALTFRPPILALDEPFGALDELTRAEMQRQLLALWEDYRPTVLFITHSVTEALFLADRIVVMSPRPGRIVSVVDAPFSRPRDLRLRNDAAFTRLCDELLTMLIG